MDYKELLEKYNILLSENNRLSEENKRLKAKLGETQLVPNSSISDIAAEQVILDDKPTDDFPFSEINNKSDSILKIKLFMSLFKGRDDVYATKWVNKNKTKSGYSPVCLNQWQAGLC